MIKNMDLVFKKVFKIKNFFMKAFIIKIKKMNLDYK